MDEERFKHVLDGPKYHRAPKRTQKVKIDPRFHGMFKDKAFKVRYKVDSRGRPIEHSSTEDSKRYYGISSESEEEEEEEEEEENSSEEVEEVGKYVKAPDGELGVKSGGDGVVSDKVKERLRDLAVDYARGMCGKFIWLNFCKVEGKGTLSLPTLPNLTFATTLF